MADRSRILAALVFMAGIAASIVCCASLSSMDALPICGGGTLSLVPWQDHAASLLRIWTVTAAAMLLAVSTPRVPHLRHPRA